MSTRFFMIARLLAAAFLIVSPVGGGSAQPGRTLTIYTYSSFVGKYGPGATIKERFEARCGCSVVYVAADDAGSLLGRLRLEGRSTKADVVLGLDMNLAAEAKALGIFSPHGLDTSGLTLPIAWTDETFVPFDWGYLAFVYDETKMERPPASLRELVENPDGPKILLQDPRTSAPGLGFLLWMHEVFGEEAQEAWRDLRPRIVTFTKGWSEAYGLFLRGEADMVLSYSTSPAYHVSVEGKTQYKAASFAEGHHLHVELAALTATSADPELARSFLEFALSPDFQSLIPEGNWMYPAKQPEAGLPASFAGLIEPSRAVLSDPQDVREKRRGLIDAWLNATTR